MNRINKLFQEKQKDILNIYFTAGYPELDSTVNIISSLEDSGVDMVEIGMPYSDPLADGPTIQKSATKAIQNGMTMKILFEQIKKARKSVDIPIIYMGYYNQILQFGFDKFLKSCILAGIDGLIVPDLPFREYNLLYKEKLEEADLPVIFLISPQTSENRIVEIDNDSKAFIYVVADNSITGAKSGISNSQIQYFKRINSMNLKNPYLAGFGISDRKSFENVCQYMNGAIIGSAFINHLSNDSSKKSIYEFCQQLIG